MTILQNATLDTIYLKLDVCWILFSFCFDWCNIKVNNCKRPINDEPTNSLGIQTTEYHDMTTNVTKQENTEKIKQKAA